MIAKLLDHESLVTTEIYAEMVNAAFREMEDSLKKQNPLQPKEKKWKQVDEQIFCRIRGYVSTVCKQGFPILEKIRDAFASNPFIPAPPLKN
ncbi:hypothetical protein JCM17380_46630 [Desulfosporosinus burensis]